MKFVKYLLIIVVILAGVILFRAWRFTPPQLDSNDLVAATKFDFNEQQAISHFGKALTFKTISTEDKKDEYGPEFDKLHTFLNKTFPKVFSTMKVTDVGNHGLLLKWTGSDDSLKPILLMAHQDVVPIAKGTEHNWFHPPFAGEVADGFVWGRGAIDVKGSMMALLETAETLLNEKFQPTRTIYFYFGDNEEIGGKTAAIASKLLQEQNVRFDFVVDEGGLITADMIPQIPGKVALISVAEKGYINVDLTTEAQGGHSSMPPKVTAIGTISDAIVRLRQHPFAPQLGNGTKQMFDTLGRHMDFPHRIILANLWFFKPFFVHSLEQKSFTNALIRTTTAPTIFNAGVKSNVLPSYASALVNFRIAPGDTTDTVISHVKDTINNPNIKVGSHFEWNPSPVSSVDSDGYRLLTRTIHQIFDNHLIIAPWVVVGATDSRHFIPVANNVYRFLPVIVNKSDIPRIHGTNERLSTENYLRMIRFYHQLLLRV